MTIWFTGDEHFDHKNIIEYCQRPFSCIEEMSETIITNANSLISKGDDVWHIGDFAWHNTQKHLARLKGIHHLILGNHDSRHLKSVDLACFASVHDVRKVKYMGQSIWASHYAHARWPASHIGRCHVFGHSHGQFVGIGRSMDVGVDALNFYPISFDNIITRLQDKPVFANVDGNRE